MGLYEAPPSTHAMGNILVAASEPGFRLLQTLLSGYPLISAHTIDNALEALQRRADIALVLCAVLFDDSRMFEFLKSVTVLHAQIPVICVRAVQSGLLRSSLDSLEEVTKQAGAKAFIDVPTLVTLLGQDRARLELQRCVRRYLNSH
jgi:DNA-binding NtrC family response regulator